MINQNKCNIKHYKLILDLYFHASWWYSTKYQSIHLVVHGTSGLTSHETIPPSHWRPLEVCCRPWTWWCNDTTALAGYHYVTIMMMMNRLKYLSDRYQPPSVVRPKYRRSAATSSSFRQCNHDRTPEVCKVNYYILTCPESETNIRVKSLVLCKQ